MKALTFLTWPTVLKMEVLVAIMAKHHVVPMETNGRLK